MTDTSCYETFAGKNARNLGENECKHYASLTNAKTYSAGSWPQDPSGCITETRKTHAHGAVWYNRRPTEHMRWKQLCLRPKDRGMQEKGAPVRSAEGRLRKRSRFREDKSH